jgi:hypothetical protein
MHEQRTVHTLVASIVHVMLRIERSRAVDEEETGNEWKKCCGLALPYHPLTLILTLPLILPLTLTLPLTRTLK